MKKWRLRYIDLFGCSFMEHKPPRCLLHVRHSSGGCIKTEKKVYTYKVYILVGADSKGEDKYMNRIILHANKVL